VERCSGGEGGAASSSVFVKGDAVHADSETDQVDVLTGVADGVGASEPERVVEVAVDGFGVVTPRVESGEVGVSGWDGPDVLCAVEPTAVVVVVGVVGIPSKCGGFHYEEMPCQRFVESMTRSFGRARCGLFVRRPNRSLGLLRISVFIRERSGTG